MYDFQGTDWAQLGADGKRAQVQNNVNYVPQSGGGGGFLDFLSNIAGLGAAVTGFIPGMQPVSAGLGAFSRLAQGDYIGAANQAAGLVQGGQPVNPNLQTSEVPPNPTDNPSLTNNEATYNEPTDSQILDPRFMAPEDLERMMNEHFLQNPLLYMASASPTGLPGIGFNQFLDESGYYNGV